ncbi:MCE family protein [Amycolatopsis cihanbeyliensis]|nr:MCE family protein [Amycolatopsis cihanbeyliensis]
MGGRFRRGLALLLALAPLLAGCGFSLHNAGFGGTSGPAYRVTVSFTDVAGLPVGGVVRIGQAEVGRVAGIRTRDFHALAELDIHAGVELPAGTRARLELTSALGEQFVALEPPDAGNAGRPLTDGALIPLERTSRGPDVENTLAAVGALLNGSGIDQLRTIVTEANAALGGRAGTVRDLLTRLDSVLSTVDAHGDEITVTIDAMHTLSTRLAEGRPTIEAALTDIRPALDALLAERERFTTLLGALDSLGRNARGLLDETGTALTAQLRALRPVLDDLRAAGADLGGTLSGLREFAGLLRRATPGDYLMLDGTLNVPLTLAEILDPGRLPGAQPPRGSAGALLEGGTR